MIDSVTVFGQQDEWSRRQLDTCMTDEAVQGVLCADHHPGYSMPIGGVIAYDGHVSPSGVGYDIGCGNLAVRTNITHEDIARSVPRIMDEIIERISFGIGRTNSNPVDHEVLDDISGSTPHQRTLKDTAAKQLGTVGAGNHYVDLLTDEQGNVWVGVHFGSRGFGHKTTSWYLEQAGAQDGMDAPPCLLVTTSDLGQSYIHAMRVAGSYAHAGREIVVQEVLDILGASQTDHVHNHHNFSWLEQHHGRDLHVVRKGSTPNFPNQRSFVGGSMGTSSFILKGTDSEANRDALYSTIHGAGRAMSRSEAAGKTKRRKVWACGDRDCTGKGDGSRTRERGRNPKCTTCGHDTRSRKVEEVVKKGKVDGDDVLNDLSQREIELRGGAADEAPAAYKDISEVLAHHVNAGTVTVEHELHPIGVAMAERGTRDPYKD
jgi:tRNA-splicing ligase RtcB